ncbi:B-cell receptor CD22 [Siphateles boraxobius]|uniref:B-cell receptor CD22 n=1 Tax=Siphateles boraxobius TaxID=180520 RepID=UPI00406392BF
MDCTAVAFEMSVFPFMVFLFFSNELVLESSAGTPVYNAELPSRITALSGSCVQIPCKFEVPADELKKAGSMFGVWIKHGHAFREPANLVVYNGSTNISTGFSRIEITGNLSQCECTTVFYDVMNNHSDNYFFRVEIDPQDWNYSYKNPINIYVSDSPQPLIFKPTDLKEVMENTTVNLSCSAEAPCPKQAPTISWSYIPESAHITAQLQEKPDKTQSVFSHMTFKASYVDHRKNISCTATYPRKTSNDSTVETTVMLQVLFPPKETRITIDQSASVSVGTNVTLTCKSKANPSNTMTFSWYKRGQDNQLDLGEQLIFTVNRSSGGWYFCIAKNEHGIQRSEEIQLIMEDQSLIIGCVVGVSALLLTLLLITLFLRVQRVKASTIMETDVSDQGQEKQVQTIYANGGFVSGEELEMPNDENDIVHYGEIDFSTPQTKITPVQGSGQETVYAEVRGPGKEMNQDYDSIVFHSVLKMYIIPFMAFLLITCEVVLISSETRVYNAELPSRITALSGSCVQIPCKFEVPADELKKAGSIFGVWIKHGHAFREPANLVVYNGSTNISTGFSRIEITGNLSQRECTTVFYDVMNNHSDNYFFRVEIDPQDWNYPYQNPINIYVSDSPQPLIFKPTDLKEVMENTTVNLSCSAQAPCPKQPPTISWSYIPESAHITTQLQEKPDKTQSVFSHMTFKASYMDHRKNISCTATYPRKTSNDSTVETTVMLQVLFPPKETRITIDQSASVSVGTNVTLTCKSKANPSNTMTFSWYKRGQDNQLDLGEQLIFTVNGSSGGWYFCIAKNEHGIQRSKDFQLIMEELSVPLIAGCVGGILALLLLFLLATLLKRAQKARAFSESIVRDTDQDHEIDCIYVNDFIKRG